MKKNEVDVFVKFHPVWAEIDDKTRLRADIAIPATVKGIVMIPIVNGLCESTMTQLLARTLVEQGIGCILVELLSESERSQRANALEPEVNTELLAERIVNVIDWLIVQTTIEGLKIGLYATGELAHCAVLSAVRRYKWISTIICCDGHFDQDLSPLRDLDCPILSILTTADETIQRATECALALVTCQKRISYPTYLTPAADDGSLRQTVQLAIDWFQTHLN